MKLNRCEKYVDVISFTLLKSILVFSEHKIKKSNNKFINININNINIVLLQMKINFILMIYFNKWKSL